MKQRQMIIIVLLISVLEARAIEVPESSNKQVIGFTPRLKKQAEIRDSFKKLSRVVNSLDSGAQLEIYRGIPRAKVSDVEDALGSRNAGHNRYIRRYGHAFYSQAVVAERNDAEKLLAIVKDPQSFRKFGGFKLCGGFHPNFALVWTKDEIAVEIHICLTCHEIKFFKSRLEIYCEMDDDAYQQFLQLGKDLKVEPE